MTILEDLRYSLFGHPVQITVQGKADEHGESVLLNVAESISALDAVIIVILIVLFLIFMWFYLSPLFRKTNQMTCNAIERGEIDREERTNRLVSWLQSRRDGDAPSGKFWNQSSATLSSTRGLGFHQTRPAIGRNHSSESSFGTPPPTFGVSVTPPPPAYASPRQDQATPPRIPALPLSSDKCPRGMPVAVPLERTSHLTIVDRPPRSPSRSFDSQAGRSRRASPAQSPVIVSHNTPSSLPVPVMSGTSSIQPDESGLARRAPTARKVSDSTLQGNEHVPSRAVMVIHVPVSPAPTLDTPERPIAKRGGNLNRMLKTCKTDMDTETSRFNAAREHIDHGATGEKERSTSVQL